MNYIVFTLAFLQTCLALMPRKDHPTENSHLSAIESEQQIYRDRDPRRNKQLVPRLIPNQLHAVSIETILSKQEIADKVNWKKLVKLSSASSMLTFARYDDSNNYVAVIFCNKFPRDDHTVYINLVSIKDDNELFKDTLKQLLNILVELNKAVVFKDISSQSLFFAVYKELGFKDASPKYYPHIYTEHWSTIVPKELRVVYSLKEQELIPISSEQTSSSAGPSTPLPSNHLYQLVYTQIYPNNLDSLDETRKIIDVYKVDFPAFYVDLNSRWIKLENYFVLSFYSPQNKEFVGYIFYAYPQDTKSVYINSVIMIKPYSLTEHASQMMLQFLDDCKIKAVEKVVVKVYNRAVHNFYNNLEFQDRNTALPLEMTRYLYEIKHFERIENTDGVDQEMLNFVTHTYSRKNFFKANGLLQSSAKIVAYLPGTAEIAGIILYQVAPIKRKEHLIKVRLSYFRLEKTAGRNGVGVQLMEYFLKFWDNKRNGERLEVKAILENNEKNIKKIVLLSRCKFTENDKQKNELSTILVLTFEQNAAKKIKYCDN